MSKDFQKRYVLGKDESASAQEMRDANEIELSKEFCSSREPRAQSEPPKKENIPADTAQGNDSGSKETNAAAALCAILSVCCLAAALIALASFVLI